MSDRQHAGPTFTVSLHHPSAPVSTPLPPLETGPPTPIDLPGPGEPLPDAHEMPPARREPHAAARRLALWTILYLASVAVLLYIVVGRSQAMRAAWLETVFSLVTPVIFLIGGWVARRPADRLFAYGYYRWVSMGFLCAALALFGLGLYLAYDAVLKIVGDTPIPYQIGTVKILGVNVWFGWPMLLVLLWASVPAWFIGRKQKERAALLHDKVLSTDAKMREADWLTSLAAAIGVVGIGTGYQILDPLAAIAIAGNVLWSGYRQLYHAAADLADSSPTTLDGRLDPLPERIRDHLLSLSWIEAADVRLREQGRLIFGEVRVVPCHENDLVRHIREAVEDLCGLDWRLQSLTIMPVSALDAPVACGWVGAPPRVAGCARTPREAEAA